MPQDVGIRSRTCGCVLADFGVMQANVFLHASGPVRMLLAGLAALKLLASRSIKQSSPDYNALLGIILYDGLGGLHLCWWLNNFTGIAPGALR
jgi:hypothetical protein